MLHLVFDVDFAFFLDEHSLDGLLMVLFIGLCVLFNVLTSSADMTVLLTAICHHVC